jgi:drug/metabolite transporter superfamily protein YnfA
MNPRLAAGIVGSLTLLMGLAALIYPERVLGFLGFAVFNASESAAALGEIRATYGGIFVVLGIFTLLATGNPAAHRSRLLLLALIWLGALAGRLFGVSVDGNPGIFGWLSALFEAAMGGMLLAAALARESQPALEPTAMPVSAGASPPVGGT